MSVLERARERPVSRISISLPENLLSDLDHMVKSRGFDSRSQAVNEMLLTRASLPKRPEPPQ